MSPPSQTLLSMNGKTESRGRIGSSDRPNRPSPPLSRAGENPNGFTPLKIHQQYPVGFSRNRLTLKSSHIPAESAVVAADWLRLDGRMALNPESSEFRLGRCRHPLAWRAAVPVAEILGCAVHAVQPRAAAHWPLHSLDCDDDDAYFTRRTRYREWYAPSLLSSSTRLPAGALRVLIIVSQQD